MTLFLKMVIVLLLITVTLPLIMLVLVLRLVWSVVVVAWAVGTDWVNWLRS